MNSSLTTEADLPFNVDAHLAMLAKKIGVRYTLDDRTAEKSNQDLWVDLLLYLPERDAPYVDKMRLPAEMVHLSTLCGAGSIFIPPTFHIKEYQGTDAGGREFLISVFNGWRKRIAQSEESGGAHTAQREWLLPGQFVGILLAGDSERIRLKPTSRHLMHYHTWLALHVDGYVQALKQTERYDGINRRRILFERMSERLNAFVAEVQMATSTLAE